jgi:hypothetical protein
MYSLQPKPNTENNKKESDDDQLLYYKTPILKLKESGTAPELYFNVKTNRWISKSCRVYRELMRDKAQASAGLPIGPKQKRFKRLKTLAPYERTPGRIKHLETMYNTKIDPESGIAEPPRKLTEEELRIQKRDKLFAKYGM